MSSPMNATTFEPQVVPPPTTIVTPGEMSIVFYLKKLYGLQLMYNNTHLTLFRKHN